MIEVENNSNKPYGFNLFLSKSETSEIKQKQNVQNIAKYLKFSIENFEFDEFFENDD